MDDLFRMLVLRAPESVESTVTVQIPVDEPTVFQRLLADARSQGRQPGETAVTVLMATASPADGAVGSLARNPGHPQLAMWAMAEEFAASPGFLADPRTLPLWDKLKDFRARLIALADPTDLVSLDATIQQSFGESAAQLEQDLEFNRTGQELGDALVAAMLSPAARLTVPDDYVLLLRLLAIIGRIAANDPTLATADAIAAALSAHVLLPASIFPVDPSMIQPMGVADDWVVRQHIMGYELGEIARIENILQGESRKHTNKHTLTTQQTLVVETDKTTETTNDLQTTDRFDLKSEIDSTLKEDTSVKAGVSVKYDSKPWTVAANVDVAYQRSKSDSTKLATEQARDVVQRATTKVTDRVRQQQTTQVTESFEDDEDHEFDNTRGTQSVTGIYQWVNKVLRVQMFDLGPRQIFDVMVPEPAALLWDLKSQPDGNLPTAPPAFTAAPSQMDPDPNSAEYFGQYLAMYGVTGVPQLPAKTTTVSATYAVDKNHDANTTLFKSEILKIPANFQAKTATVTTQFDWTDTSHALNVLVGGKSVSIASQDMSPHGLPMNDETDTVPVAVETWNIGDYVLTVDISCEWTAEAKANWQLQVHSAIVQAYLQQVKDYQEKLNAQKFQATASDQIRGTNPDANRQIERTELKRQTIALLAGPTVDLLAFDAVMENSQPPHDPRPNPAEAMYVGRIARFFEEALEWENLNYFFYPYYWGRSKYWYQRMLAGDDDPLFAEFLRAGQARVVVPVRRGFESDIQHFIDSGGQLWGGAPLPDVHGTDYLPIAEEIRAAQHPDTGVPGEWWEAVLPTNQEYLRADACLPTWSVDSQWRWTPDTTPCQNTPAKNASSAPSPTPGGPTP